MLKPTLSELVEKAGISIGAASDMLNGRTETYSWRRAIHVYRTTGWLPDKIEHWTEEMIDALESVEPYRPCRKKAA